MSKAPSFADAAHGGRHRILVLGASGFIGKAIVKALAGSDWATPIAASFRGALYPDNSIETVRVDARDAEALKRALTDVDGVVNCITGDGATIIASAQVILDTCCTRSSPPRVVHISTMMVYGTATGVVDETVRLRGDWDEYSAAKTAVEKLSRGYPCVVTLRPGIVYGPGSPIWSKHIGQWLRAHRLGDLGNAGLGICNLVHIDDVVQAILQALRLRGIEGNAFNLSLPSPPTWNDYFRRYSAALGTACVPISSARLTAEIYLMAPPLKLAEIVARMIRLGRPPAPIRPWLLRLCAHPIQLDVQKAERVLGMRWTAIDAGLEQSAAWTLAAG